MSTSQSANRGSRTSNPPSRPTTPLRPSSRTSLRSPHAASGAGGVGGSSGGGGSGTAPSPLGGLEPGFAELADSMADLEANMMHMQLLHESLARFGENFAAFLYGLNMNAFCVDFPEGPTDESWKRAEARRAAAGDANPNANGAPSPARQPLGGGTGYDPETTFMTTDTSFVDNPPQSTKTNSRLTTPAGASTASNRRSQPRGGTGIGRGTAGRGASARGASSATGSGRGAPTVRGTRASGLARASAASRARGGRA